MDDRRGNIAVIVGLAMTTIAGSAAIGVDMNYLFTTRADLRFTADAAAIAAAAQLPDEAAATAAAIDFANRNMPPGANGNVVTAGDVFVGNWNAASRVFTAGGSPSNAVRVAARRTESNGNPVEMYFARIIGFDSINVSAEATAAGGVGGGDPACILALHPSDPSSFYVQGTAFVRAVDCNIHVNSSDPVQAMFAKGNVDLEVYVDAEGYTGEIHVNGAVRKEGPAYISPTPITGSDPVDDPFASRIAESVADTDFRNAGCTYNNYSSTGTVVLQPGVYCGGIQLAGVGTVTFAGTGDGIYVIRDGELSVAGTLAVDGQGAAFYLTGAAARANFLGTADIRMTAPTSGKLKGFIFFGDHLNPTAVPHSMRGTELGGYYGGLYFPNAIVDFHGTANGTIPGGSDCTVAVADKFIFAGEPTFHSESTCTDLPDLLSGASVALVN